MGASHAKFLREVLQELTIDPSSVVETNEKIGVGSFGEVVVVKVNGSRCACKKLHDILAGSRTQENSVVQRFVEECERLSKLHHPHIVQFLGVHFFGHSSNPSLVMELLPTNLGDFLDEYKDVPSSVKHSILYDISLGLLYLHSSKPVPIIHRDLTVNNILLTHSLRAKITDLGVARTLDITYTQRQSPMMTICPGNPCSMPPEALGDHPVYDTKLDVFSFGHIIVHVAIQEWPMPLDAEYTDPNTMEVLYRTEIERREDFISKMGGDNPLRELAVSCLQNDPSLRPTTRQLVEKMDQFRTYTPLPYLSLIDTMREIDNLSARNRDLKSQVEEKNDAVQKAKKLEVEIEAKNAEIVAKNAEIERLKSQLAAVVADRTTALVERMHVSKREANTQTVPSPTRESTPPTPKPRQQRSSTSDIEAPAQLSAAYPTPKPRKRLATCPNPSLTRPHQTSSSPHPPVPTHETDSLEATAEIKVKSPLSPSAINQTTGEVNGLSNQAQQVAMAHSETQYRMHDYSPPTTAETASTEAESPPLATAATDQIMEGSGLSKKVQQFTKTAETSTEAESPPLATAATDQIMEGSGLSNKVQQFTKTAETRTEVESSPTATAPTTEMDGRLPTTHKNGLSNDTKSVATAFNESRYHMHDYSPPPPEVVSGAARTDVKSPSSATAATSEVNGLPNKPQEVASTQKETQSRVQGNRPHQKLARQRSGTFLLGAEADPMLATLLKRRKQRENEAGEKFKELEAARKEKYESNTLPRRKPKSGSAETTSSELQRILEKRRSKIEEPN